MDNQLPANQQQPIVQPPSVTVGKEYAPIHVASTVEQQPTPVMQLSSPELAIPKELANFVESAPNTENLVIPDSLQKLGITQAPATTLAPNAVAVPTQLPMSYAQAYLTQHHEKIKNSIKWFAAVVVRELRKLNPTIYK